MGLSITVQKGHDFSSGNVTRAALNAGATPTIAVTGSVGDSEIAPLSINNGQIKNDAAIAVTKLGLTANSLIIGDGDNEGSVLSPTSAFSSLGNDVDSNCGLLVDTGAKFELLKTDVSSIGGQIKLTKYLQTIEDGDDKFWLKLTVNNDSLGAAHFLTSDTLDNNSLGKNSAGKFEVKDNGVHHQKLYNYRDSSGNPKAGFLYYGSGGTAKVLESTGSSQVALTGGANGDFSLKTFNKVVTVSTTIVVNAWMTGAHGITTATGTTNHPHLVAWYLECTIPEDNFVAGDRVYMSPDYSATNLSTVYVDGTNVGIFLDSTPNFHDKTGTSASTKTAANWKVMAVVSEF